MDNDNGTNEFIIYDTDINIIVGDNWLIDDPWTVYRGILMDVQPVIVGTKYLVICLQVFEGVQIDLSRPVHTQ